MIDVHTHMMRPQDWGPEYQRNWSSGYGRGWPEPDPGLFDQTMATAGVDTAIVFGIRASYSQVATATRVVVDFCKSCTTRCLPFMALDLNDDSWRQQFEEGLTLGVRGVKLYPVMAVFDPRERRFDPFYQLAEQHQLPILWHMGATLSAQGSLADSLPIVLDDVARRFPNLPQIIAHMGHPWQRDTVQVIRKNRRVYADVSGMWTRPMDGYLALVNAQEWGVVDKLLFGSDFPLWTPAETIAGLYRLTEFDCGSFPKVATETIDRIFSHDTLALLGLKQEVSHE